MIEHYVRVDADDIVISAFEFDLSAGPVEFPPCPEGLRYAPVDAPFARNPATPTSIPTLQGREIVWLESGGLADAQANAWEAVKRARDEAESADFEFEGRMYQPDVPKVTGASLAALMAQVQGVPFNETWTLSDDTTVDLTGQQVMALGVTLLARISAIHHKGRMLRSLIDNAATPAEAYSYTWESTHAE